MAKVYRVLESALAPDAPHAPPNKAFVEQHGWLWVHVEGTTYRSVATGDLAYFWSRQLEELENG